MADGPQKPEQSGTEAPKSGLAFAAAQKLDDSLRKIDAALNKKENEDSLNALGTEMLHEFSQEKYTPEVFLSSLQEVFYDHEHQFNPPMDFFEYVEAFGPDMVILCQKKLKEAGMKLGKFGPNKDGIDGKLGNITAAAFNKFYDTVALEDEKAPPDQKPTFGETKAKIGTPSKYPKTEEDVPKQVADLSNIDGLLAHPFERGKEPYHKTHEIISALSAYHNQTESTVVLNNLVRDFGEKEKFGPPFLITEDPITHGPIKFLGRTIENGIHAALLPPIKAAEEKIAALHLNYQPGGIGGTRKNCMMSFNGKLSDTIPSFHAWGLAFDIDAGENFGRHGRGTIPDEVAAALVESGLHWGLIGNPSKPPYLGKDPMHFQLRYLPNDPNYLSSISGSSEGMKYYRKLKPVLDKM